MNFHGLRLAALFTAAFAPLAAGAQHETHQAGAPQTSLESGQCARIQPAVDNIITNSMGRLESARQSNNPAELRAAIDHLEAVLRDIRTQLAPCSAAGVAADPHAGQTMPGMQQPAGPPVPANQTSPAAPDPHAGHAMPAAPAAPKSTATPKPAPSKVSSRSPADPHAGHAMPTAAAAPKSAPPSKPAPSKPERPETADSHAGHAAGEQSEKHMDPVNGLMVDPAASPKTAYQGQTYYFSSEQTRKEFLENPAKFAKKPKG
jgi:YHS domain-containing protein